MTRQLDVLMVASWHDGLKGGKVGGIRPLRGDSSSLEAWFPYLKYTERDLADPDYGNCVNPMRVGIRFSDAVHVVSPNYAEEILKPSIPKRCDPNCVFYGGEGLERDLEAAKEQNRLRHSQPL